MADLEYINIYRGTIRTLKGYNFAKAQCQYARLDRLRVDVHRERVEMQRLTAEISEYSGTHDDPACREYVEYLTSSLDKQREKINKLKDTIAKNTVLINQTIKYGSIIR